MVALDGYKTADKSIESVVGQTDRLELTLEATSNNATGANGIVVQPFGDTPKDRVASSKPNPWILVGGGVVTVGGLVTGLVLNSKGNSEYDKAHALRDKVGASGCYSDATSSDCVIQKRHLENGDRDKIISGVAFGVGGAALVATAVYWLWPRKATKSATSTSPQLTSYIGPGGSWVGLTGSY